MKKICADCVHYYAEGRYKDYPHCLRTRREVMRDRGIVTGEAPQPYYTIDSCWSQRIDDLVTMFVFRSCGKIGRFFKRKGASA